LQTMADLFGGNDYDRGVNTFSPEGRLFQVEYAIEAIKLGTTVIGIQTAHGIVLGAEKRVNSKLQYTSSLKKISEVTDVHLVGVSGLAADGNLLLDKGRVEAENYKFTYNEYMPTGSLVRRMADFMMSFGDEDSKMARPLGVSMLVAGVDEVDDGKRLLPKLFHLDPSGTYIEYRAKAIGAGEESAMSSLTEKYNTSMTLDEAMSTCVEILKAVMEEKITEENVDIWLIECKQEEDGGWKPEKRKIKGDEFERVLANVGEDEVMAS